MKNRKPIKINFSILVLFSFFFATLCKEKMNIKNIFVRIYPSDINDYNGVINIEKGIYFQENYFICNQSSLKKIFNTFVKYKMLLTLFIKHLKTKDI